jgi:hypothetical protein
MMVMMMMMMMSMMTTTMMMMMMGKITISWLCRDCALLKITLPLFCTNLLFGLF